MKYIATFYIWLVGGLSFLFVFLFIILVHRFVKIEFIYKTLRNSFKFILSILFMKHKIIFEDEILEDKSYIFMPNHVSMMDVLITTAYFPVNMNAIEAQSHFSWPIYGKVAKIVGQIPINRKSPRDSIRSFQIAKERLKTGRSIIVFPEGTRSKGHKMNSFKTLPFKFAKETYSNIVPVALLGLEKISPEFHFWIRPTKVKIIFGKQITREQMNNLSAQELSDTVKSEIERMQKQYI